MLALAFLALTLASGATPPEAPPPPGAEAPPAPAQAPSPPRAAPPPRAARGGEAAPRVGAGEAEEPVLRGFEKRSGRRFTADFDEAEVDDALRQIAEAADWSIVLPSGEHGTISARFKNAPVEDALRAVLAQADLTAVREGSIVTVRAPSFLPGFPRSVGKDFRRAAEEARRAAERATRDVEREMDRLERETGGENDRVVHGDVVVRPGETARDVVAIRGSIKLEPGAEARDLVAVLGSVVLEPGALARGAVAVGGDVKLGPGAEIAKDAVSVGGHVETDPSAVIGGETVSVGIPALSGLAGLAGSRMLFGQDESPVLRVAQALAKFAVYFVLGLLVLTLFPRRLDAVAASFTAHPWKSILTGLLGLVVTPLVVLLLIATVIGIPLVPVAGILLVAAGVLGFTALAWYVGRALPLTVARGANVLQLALGTAIVVLVTAIPFLGCMAWITGALLGFGAVLRSRFGSHAPVLPTTIAPPAAPPPAAAP